MVEGSEGQSFRKRPKSAKVEVDVMGGALRRQARVGKGHLQAAVDPSQGPTGPSRRDICNFGPD